MYETRNETAQTSAADLYLIAQAFGEFAQIAWTALGQRVSLMLHDLYLMILGMIATPPTPELAARVAAAYNRMRTFLVLGDRVPGHVVRGLMVGRFKWEMRSGGTAPLETWMTNTGDVWVDSDDALSITAKDWPWFVIKLEMTAGIPGME